MADGMIKDGVFCHIARDKERKLFDQLVPLPEGTTYNSYLVKGAQKTALIDAVYPKKCAELLAWLDEMGVNRLDYVIANHAEQDHSGSLPMLLEKYAGLKIVTNQKCKENIINFLHAAEGDFITVAEGDTLELGGKTLKFMLTPWVHWPDTMMTFIVEDNLLCTCDLFGAHYTHNGMFADHSKSLLLAAKRYFAEIMMPFRNFAAKYVQAVKRLAPEMILPSHGPVYKDPSFITDAYEDWTSPLPRNTVVSPFVSMYESVKIMVDFLAHELTVRGVEVKTIDLSEADEGELAMEILDAATIVVGVSMVLAGPHPRAVYAAHLASILRPKAKFCSIVGSYGWGGNLTSLLQTILAPLKMELVEPVIAKGKPQEADFEKLRALADAIAQKHSAMS